MRGKILEINGSEAFISFEDGNILEIGISFLPLNSKIGDSINFSNIKNNHLMNDRMINNLF